MAYTETFEAVEPARSAVDAWRGAAVLEFGTPWCGYCRAARPLIAEAFAAAPKVRHVKVEDGRGRPLGRSFHVKLWPTLVFLRDGKEVGRLVRPDSIEAVRRALQALAVPSGGA
ncbi:MAG TPA: thioredoxin family protein [Nevskiaceae bacterium]